MSEFPEGADGSGTIKFDAERDDPLAMDVKPCPAEMIRLVYSSRATQVFDEDALLTLLEIARAENARLQVSGILLHANGTFIQALEGDPEVVESLYAKIETDSRHDETRILLREEIVERAFGDWTMGFVAASKELIESIDGLNGFLQSSVPGHVEEDDPTDRARKILEQFKSGRWRREIEG